MRRISELEQQIVRELIDAQPAGAVVVDAPCGNGRMSRWASRRGDLKLVLVDRSPDMLDALKIRNDARLLQKRVQADVMQLPLADKSVDLMINIRLMHHMPDTPARIRLGCELARVTRGTLVTSYWSTHAWRVWRRRLRGKRLRSHPISPREFEAICQESGLQVERIIPVHRWYEEQCMVICKPAG